MTQQAIVKELGVQEGIQPTVEIERRVQFLMDYLKASNQHYYVLGISGGVDSSTAGMLASLACAKLRDQGYPAEFIAVRLPYGVQRDEVDAQLALKSIQPFKIITVDIKPATDGMMAMMGMSEDDPVKVDFVRGNVKARQRMIAQYAIAGSFGGIVIGTDHAAEALMGFFTKHGDGACDVTPLSGLNKRQVRQVAMALGLPEALVVKTPTADLEDLNPGKPDEDAYGVTYNEIDDFLQGRPVSVVAHEIILRQYNATKHKRALPVGV